ncbi:hypothetical protein [Yinghuangia soli]|uniref:Restriction endonuclease n=1 Tax=Yinghuangia soli TaxID=2908204 RepID=A0AA41Q5K6_9ACTN|nr:hypothetical protein [Yinghuangia soli]MCF2531968.1 hypothetical protein [Yinghuangia soli]
MRSGRYDEPGMFEDGRWWLMVAAGAVTAGVIAVGFVPGTGLTSDARATAVLGGIVFGGWAVQDTWAWWRRRSGTLVEFVLDGWIAFARPGHRKPLDREAAHRVVGMTADRLAAHVAWLCERDGLADVRTELSADNPRLAEVSATAPDGTRLVVRVHGRRVDKGGTAVRSALMRAFIARAGRDEPGKAVYAFASAAWREQGAAFTHEARVQARRHGIVMLPADDLGLWEIGLPPRALVVVPRTRE